MEDEAELIPVEPRPYFLHPLLSYRHRICFDNRDNSFIGLVRALYLSQDEGGSFVEVLCVLEGVETRVWFRDFEIGYLDFSPCITLTADELLEDLNEYKRSVEAGGTAPWTRE